MFHNCVTKAVVCTILYGMVHINDLLLLIGKANPCSGGSGFLFVNWMVLYFMFDAIKQFSALLKYFLPS